MEGEVDFEIGQSFRTFPSLEASLLRWQDRIIMYSYINAILGVLVLPESTAQNAIFAMLSSSRA